MSRSASEDLPQIAIIRYSRDALLKFNVQHYDAQLSQKIIECLKPFKIDKGNSESVIKTDSKRPPADQNLRISNPQSPLQSTLNLNQNRANARSCSPIASPQVAATRTLLPINNQLTPKQRGLTIPKFQPVNGIPNQNLSNSNLKENENQQNLNKKLPKTTPNKKVPVAYQPKTPIPTTATNSTKQLSEPRMPLKSIDSNSSPSLMSVSFPSSPISSPMIDNTPASPSKPPMSPTSSSKTPSSNECSPKTSPSKLETDPHRLQQRQKQIDYGYKTLGYIRYRLVVPKETRTKEQPKTPKKSQFCSKRSWDGQVKKWRRELHLWDPTDPKECEPYFDEDLLISLFESTLEVDSIKKQLEEQVEELRVNGRLLLSPNDKHLAKMISSKGGENPGDLSSSSNASDITYADTQPNRIFPSVDSPSSANYVMDDSTEESYNVPHYLQKQPIARVLVFSAEC